MNLIIGGAYQGKLSYAKEQYHKSIVADGNKCTLEDTYTCEILNEFQALIRRYFNSLDKVISYIDKLLRENPNIVVISTEIGCGLISIDKSDRLYRELVGRVCCEMSKRAETVERVFCGLAVTLK